MAKAGYEFQEVRIIYEPELTQVYVLLRALGDCPIGVQGWHHKTFPASVTGLEALKQSVDAVMWPLNAPTVT